jgi:hypothetical protein
MAKTPTPKTDALRAMREARSKPTTQLASKLTDEKMESVNRHQVATDDLTSPSKVKKPKTPPRVKQAAQTVASELQEAVDAIEPAGKKLKSHPDCEVCASVRERQREVMRARRAKP